MPGRWRVRRATASRDDARGRLVVGLPHVQRQHGDVGRRDVLRRRVGGVYQAGAADRGQGGAMDPRGLWSGDAAVLLGAGSCRAVVFGQYSVCSGGCDCLLEEACPQRDNFFRSEKSRVQYAEVSSHRPAASLTVIDSRVFSVYLDCLCRLMMRQGGIERDHSS